MHSRDADARLAVLPGRNDDSAISVGARELAMAAASDPAARRNAVVALRRELALAMGLAMPPEAREGVSVGVITGADTVSGATNVLAAVYFSIGLDSLSHSIPLVVYP